MEFWKVSIIVCVAFIVVAVVSKWSVSKNPTLPPSNTAPASDMVGALRRKRDEFMATAQAEHDKSNRAMQLASALAIENVLAECGSGDAAVQHQLNTQIRSCAGSGPTAPQRQGF